MSKELHVFGCSFTDYPQWPIWADWLAMYFPDRNYFKHATGGIGNRGIFYKILNVLSSMETYENKVFVIQWGSCAREDRFQKEYNHASTLQNLYNQCGALGNTHCYKDDFVKNEFSFQQSVYEHYNQVWAVGELLESKKVNYIMTYMLDPTIDSMLGEPGFNSNNEWASVDEIDSLQPLFSKLKRLYSKYNFTDVCMSMDQLEHNDIVYSFSDIDGTVIREGHPSPREGYLFMKNYILPMLPFLGKPTEKQIKEIEDLVHIWLEFAKLKKDYKDKDEPDTWPCHKRFSNTSPVNVQKYLGYLFKNKI